MGWLWLSRNGNDIDPNCKGQTCADQGSNFLSLLIPKGNTIYENFLLAFASYLQLNYNYNDLKVAFFKNAPTKELQHGSVSKCSEVFSIYFLNVTELGKF